MISINVIIIVISITVVPKITRLQCHAVKNIVKLSNLDPINILNSSSSSLILENQRICGICMWV
jgi:hypothetical protein